MLVDERREQFKTDVNALKLKSHGGRRDGLWRGIGAALMVVGVVGAFLAYLMSLSVVSKNALDATSDQVLATAFLALTVLGAALYLAGAIASVLRLWLLRQLYEGQQQAEQLADVLRERTM